MCMDQGLNVYVLFIYNWYIVQFNEPFASVVTQGIGQERQRINGIALLS